MSLLDDVSIVVTPNGYKAGTLYSVLPTAIAGSELVQDSNFTLTGTQAQNTAGTYWVTYAGWTISGGKALRSGVSSNSPIAQNVPVVNGKVYKFSYTRTYASGNGETNLFVQTDGSNYVTLGSYTSTVVEEHTVTGTFVAGFTGNIFWQLYGIGTFTGTVDNVSVKEWSGADMNVTRATASTRVDENGLVNYAEVLGSELVTDGGFPTGTTAWTVGGGWSIGNSVAEADGSTSTSNVLSQDLGLVATKNYIISFSSNRVGGTLFVKNGNSYQSTTIYTLNTGTGLEVQTFTLNLPSNSELGFYAFDYEGTIDNVTVKQTDRNNVPRIDYTGGGCPHILAEPQRTNSLFQSNQFDTTWVLTNSSVVGNQSGIYNTTDAWKLVGNGSNNDRLNSNSLSSGAYTFSIYAKAGNSKFTAVVLGSAVVYYNLETGSVGSAANVTNSSIESVGNDWYRLTLSVASFTGSAQIYIANGVGNVNTSNGDFIYLQHAQAEVGSYATSIIPTSGSAVTRNKDVFTRDGIASLINSTEGVLFGEIAALSNTSTDRVMLSLSDGTTSNRVYIRYGNASNQIEARSTVGGANSGLTSFVVTDETDFIKVAYKWKLNDYALWINGVEVATVSSGVVNSANTLNKLSFDSGSGTRIAEGKIKQLMCFDEALSDEELSDLTGQANLSFNNLAEFYGYTIL